MLYSSRSLSYFLIFFLNFLTGVEYAVILPSALQYLQRYNGNQFELGLCLSAYSLSSLFSSPLMGKWSDVYNNTKLIIIFANLWQIAGSLMYFMGISTTFIIGGRLVAGVGLGVVSCTFSDIVKTTNAQERSTILSRIMIGRQLGMIIGPAFNFILLKVHAQIGPFLLDNLSAPGLFMASMWFLLQILVVLFYKNLHEFNAPPPPSSLSVNADERSPLLSSNRAAEIQPSSSQHEPNVVAINVESGDAAEDAATGGSESSLEKSGGSRAAPHKSGGSGSQKYDRIRVVDNLETGHILVRLYEQYIKEEIVTVYTTTFTVFFMQTSLETLLTPFTRDYFHWSDTQNSIFYAIAGLDIMVVFFILGLISKRVKDRSLLLIGIIGNLITLIFLMVYLPYQSPDKKVIELKDYALFMLPVFANVSSLPLIVLGSISLLSKLTSLETQGLTQGIRRTVVGIACILGPNWSGTFYGQWYVLIGSLIGVLSLSLLMTLLSFKHLRANESMASSSR